MARTTLDIDDTLLRRAKRLAKEQGKSLGGVVSELLATAMARPEPKPSSFRWRTKSMRARVDLEDKDAVYTKLDRG